MPPHLYLVPQIKILEPARTSQREVKIAVELRTEAYAHIARFSKARQDFITLRNLCLEQIVASKSLIAILDAHISEHHAKFTGMETQ